MEHTDDDRKQFLIGHIADAMAKGDPLTKVWISSGFESVDYSEESLVHILSSYLDESGMQSIMEKMRDDNDSINSGRSISKSVSDADLESRDHFDIDYDAVFERSSSYTNLLTVGNAK